MARTKKHVHKYRHIDFRYAKVWSCALPDCNHYMPAHMTISMPGKKSLCWECDKEFILDENNMKNDMPVCFNCANPELVEKIEDMEDPFMARLKAQKIQ